MKTHVLLAAGVLFTLAFYSCTAQPRCDVRAVLSGEMYSGPGC